ncbi:class I SAM-dependent methyltransferase [Sphingomonas psychrotolerans]|uniref:Class I SAM-dependent methyltransferase n=1 Tax=Sphingomonas psychrotolerans TaxID=1327635 RepID=A0ABU3MZ26_9SPHN|nr:class I SAM-dependent methyltransferase [Sphingomonas psychrotolerans]MDT8757226.1 class I SAM-dependent methyltransferase [Sphingomonas psychrotolerans]
MTIDALRPYWSGLFSEKRFFTYHRCLGCGLLYNRAFFDGPRLAELYSSMAPNMEIVSDDAIAATQRGYFSATIGQAALDGGYLEIGPDTGHIVREAAARGSFEHFWLFEPNRAIHDTLRASAGSRPATLLTEMDDLSPVPDGSIGLAVMVHVLDHLLDPLAMLTQIRAKLRPGGTLLIVTHNEKSLLRRLMGARWPPFCLQHPELYNPATITALLGRAGFAGVQVTRSRNYFPLPFLARQAAWTVGLKLDRAPLPEISLGLRLGNMLTLATAPAQAATGTEPWLRAAE